MLCAQDYLQADIPTFHRVYGYPVARAAVIVSSLLTAFSMAVVFSQLRYPSIAVLLLTCFSLGWVGLAIENSRHPSSGALLRLYKSSSLYMMGIMLILILDGVLKNA
jgi:heme O synthase-like polyprenyltransferase